MHRVARLVALGVLLGSPLILGCSNQPPLAEVRGKLMMNGKPLKNVRVDFHPNPDKGTRGNGSSGTTNENGEFALSYTDGSPGAIVGHHRIILTDLDVFGNVLVGRSDYRTDDPKGPKETPAKPRFPDSYSSLAHSPLSQEVSPGMGPITLEIRK